MPLTLDSGDGRGTLFEVADRSVLVPFNTNAQNWSFATFIPDATKFGRRPPIRISEED